MVSNLAKVKAKAGPVSVNTTFSDKKAPGAGARESEKSPDSPRFDRLEEFKKINDFGADALEQSKATFENNFEIMVKKSLSAVRSKCADYNFYVKNNNNKLLI